MFAQWCSSTACEGVKDLYESKGNVKHFTFWAVVMMAMLAASVFFTYRTILGYLDTPRITNVDTVTNATLEMPEILLTYNGGFNMSTFRLANLSENFVKTITASMYFNYRPGSKMDESLNGELERYMKIKNFTLYEAMKSFGYECSALIDSMLDVNAFKRNPCPVAQLMLTDRGNSYVFKKLGQQWYPGYWGGLAFTLTAPNDSFVHVYPQESLEFNMNDEFSITLEHSFGSQLSGRNYPIPRNSKVEMTLNTKRYKRLNYANRCSDSVVQVTSNNCYFLCWATEMELVMGCYFVAVIGNGKLFDPSKMCNPFSFAMEFQKHANVSRVQKCQQNCVPSCDEWIYEVTLAYSTLDYLKLDNSLSVVYVFYNTMQYTKIEEVYAFTIDMAIANVGGQPGLWLGISMITVIQAFYFLWLALWKKVSSIFTKRNKGLEFTRRNNQVKRVANRF